jgi:predicted nucleotidyltransferase
MDKKQIIEIVKKYKELVSQHIKIEDMYIYGSYANNTNNKDSDIDVAVVVKNSNDDFFLTNPLLWKLRREIDDRIEPVLIERTKDKTDFLANIINNGIKIN